MIKPPVTAGREVSIANLVPDGSNVYADWESVQTSNQTEVFGQGQSGGWWYSSSHLKRVVDFAVWKVQ